MNAMSAQLSDRIRAVTSQRNEQEAILSSMVEGVVAVDREDRILTINQAAGKILGVDSFESIGRPIQEVIRVSQLAILADRSRKSGVPVEEDFQVSGKENDTYLQAHANVLRDGRGAIIGTVIVLNDLTRIRQLENIRREFVANVSHELRTPLTLVKGYVETILESGVDSPEDTERFIRIISRHVDRLNNIIEDLLSLSRIEQSSDHDEISLQKGLVSEIADQVIEIQRGAAEERRITIRNLCPPDTTAKFSRSLLEQALLNLVDNAVKYSPDGSTVSISASRAKGMVAVQVTDNGPGISTEHHGRIFERFYRVDRGRSRDLGGTGLGLAIVKHIAIAMGGRVAVDSAPGKGSTFTIFLNTV
jgi:two-component system phosphate regulon sensor histidine kinase PhoR